MALVESTDGWLCMDCGRQHQGLITCFGPHEPHGWYRASRLARLQGRLAHSFCEVTVEGQLRHYVRGHLSIPVKDGDGSPFLWSVLVEVDKADFDRMVHSLNDPARVEQPTVHGVLDVPLPYEPPTQGLPVEVHQQPVGEVPQVVLTQRPDHLLQREQRQGITMHRIAEINAAILVSRER